MTSYVRDYFDRTGRRTSGAALAEAIRKRFPGFAFEQLGLSRLVDAVHRAEEAGGLVRHRDVEHLEVSPSETTPRSASARTMSTMSLYVRPDVWRAFVFVADRYAHFLDRTTGRLVTLMLDDADQVQAQERDPRFIRIVSLAPEAQKEWMRQFVQSQESLNVEDAPFDEERWWIAFPSWLQDQGAANILAWRRFRAEKVVTFIREWANENCILLDSLFSPPRLPAPAGTRRPDRPAENEETRRAIIAAIEDMPFEQLQELAIPVRYMLRHFRPR
jgi:hypothetical protein